MALSIGSAGTGRIRTMRSTRLFAATLAAALASLLGLGPEAAAGLDSRPETYQARHESAAALPVWLVRYKLRQHGYRDITAVSALPDGFAVLAHDRWGRRVRLFVDGASGETVPRGGYGLAHLKPADVAAHLAALGYECLSPISFRHQHYEALARAGQAEPLRLHVDPLSGAVWHERA
ncbi:MAG TPA: hypothetical protein VL244_06365 [Alphaproteobacteria bacterium]|nr:hypothetical protein [Alphaproteobacteria bacterium]